jgi:hypothetical protein
LRGAAAGQHLGNHLVIMRSHQPRFLPIPRHYSELNCATEIGVRNYVLVHVETACIFVWGGEASFVCSESGQKESIKLLQNIVYNTIQHPPPPHSHTLSVYTVHLVWEGGGGSQSEGISEGNSTQVYFLRPWGQQFTSWVKNTNYE